MKQITSSFICILISSLLLISCNKDDSGTNPTNPTVSTLLAKVYVLDTTLSAPRDTISRTTMSYDIQDRLTLMNGYSTNNLGAITAYFYRKFEYNGSGTLASRKIQVDSLLGAFPHVLRDTIYFTFASSKCIIDSTANGNFFGVSRYTYNAAYIKNDYAYKQQNGSITRSTSNIYQTKVGTNIIYQVDTTWSVPITSSYSVHKINSTYLDKPNPVYSLYYPTHLEYLNDVLGINSDQPPTNLVSQQTYTSSNNGGPTINTFTINYTYQFRSDGVPTIVNEVSSVNGAITRNKYVFVYR